MGDWETVDAVITVEFSYTVEFTQTLVGPETECTCW